MKIMKYGTLVLAALGALVLVPLDAAAVQCKAGQKLVGSHCVAASSKAKGTTSYGASSKSAKAKGKAGKSTGKGKGAVTSTEPLRERLIADCDSAQAVLQGGAGQCPAPVAGSGLLLATAPAANPGAPCFEALASSNAARRLSYKVPFFAASAPGPEAFDNKSVPGKMEREELHSVLSGYGMCLDMAAAWRSEAYAPAVLGTLDAYWQEAQSILNALAAGKKTWGEAARAIADNDRSTRSRLAQTP